VVLRKEGVIPLTPSDQEAENDLIQEEAQAIHIGKGKTVTEDDIINAFSNGDEVEFFFFLIFA
jgi:hypothetical protein